MILVSIRMRTKFCFENSSKRCLWDVFFERSSLLRFCQFNGWQPCHYGRQLVVVIFMTLMDGSLVIMEGIMLSISLLLQWMLAQSLWKLVCFRDFYYSNGWQPCHYGRQSLFDIFVTPMDCSLVIMEGSLLSRFLLLKWMVAL